MKFITRPLMMSVLLATTSWTVVHGQSLPSQRIGLVLEDNRSVYTTVGERNQYENDLRLKQPSGNYQLTAGVLNQGNNHIVLHRIDDEGNDSTIARINLNAVKTVPQSQVIDILDFYQDGAGAHSGSSTVTQAMLPENGNWGTNGSNLIWQASGYAYISGQGGFTFTVPAGSNDAILQFIIYNGPNARGGYWVYNLNNEGWAIAARATASGSSSFAIDGLSTGDVISFYGAQLSSNQYYLYQSPDIELIGVVELPNSYVPTIEVTPAVSKWSQDGWGEETTISSSTVYQPNDTINLYGLGCVTDRFNESTADNGHSNYFKYHAALDANVILPADGATGMDFYSSADFTGCTTSDPSSATMTGYNGWSFNSSSAYSSSGLISMYIQSYGAVIFTMPDNFMGTSVNVTVTTSTGTDGAGIVVVNNEPYTFTAGGTHTWTVPVAAGGTIEFKSGGETYSADIASIVISSGNGSAASAPAMSRQGSSMTLSHGFKPRAATAIGQSQKERIINVKINE